MTIEFTTKMGIFLRVKVGIISNYSTTAEMTRYSLRSSRMSGHLLTALNLYYMTDV